MLCDYFIEWNSFFYLTHPFSTMLHDLLLIQEPFNKQEVMSKALIRPRKHVQFLYEQAMNQTAQAWV